MNTERSGLAKRGWGVCVASAAMFATVGCSTSPAVDTVILPIMGGTFLMGSNADCKDSFGAVCTGDRVAHKVRVTPFSLDATEVSKKQYANCVNAGMCPADGALYSELNDLPVLVDDPESARKYCAFRHPAMRLPTEAEFEFASRVQPSGNVQNFAWGDQPPSCARLPIAGCDEQGVRPVGTSPGDVSPWGVKDLAGNVPEWVDDTYSPYTGCADHMSYGELCWGRNNGCADARCGLDGLFCAKGCIPAPAPQQMSTPMMGGTPTAPQPVCLAALDATTIVNPVVHSGGAFGVIRGGMFTDGACAFAGFSRRYAAPKSYSAGFRCATSSDLRAGISNYRFRVQGCPPNGRVKVVITDAVGKGNGYSLNYFPSNATGDHSIAPCGKDEVTGCVTDQGVIDEVPCDAVMVVFPPSTSAINLQLSTVNNPNCLGATQKIPLNTGADTPSPGVDTITLMPANNCS